MSFSKPTVFDFTRAGFIPLYDIALEEIKSSKTSSISPYITKHIHPPTTKYSLRSANHWISRIDLYGAFSDNAEQVAGGFRLPRDALLKIMTEADSLIPLDKHVLPIINHHLSETVEFSKFPPYEIQLSSELTISLKDVQKEDVVPGGVTYPIFRPDRVYLKTHIADEPPSWKPPPMEAVSYGPNVGLHRLARDDHSGLHSARDDAMPDLSADAALRAQFLDRAEEATAPAFFKGDYGVRSQKYLPNADDGRPNRTKGFLIIEGKMAGILLRCTANIEAACTTRRPFSVQSLSLLKQAYAYALAFRTQHVALYDYTTLILIQWPHLDTSDNTLNLWTFWNNPVSARDSRLASAITVITDRDLMVPSLAGFMIDALQTCQHQWYPEA